MRNKKMLTTGTLATKSSFIDPGLVRNSTTLGISKSSFKAEMPEHTKIKKACSSSCRDKMNMSLRGKENLTGLRVPNRAYFREHNGSQAHSGYQHGRKKQGESAKYPISHSLLKIGVKLAPVSSLSAHSFKYYISEASKELKAVLSEHQDRGGLFLQHLLLSMTVRKAYRFASIPKEPKFRISLSDLLPETRIAELSRGKKLIIFDMDETLLHSQNCYDTRAVGSGDQFLIKVRPGGETDQSSLGKSKAKGPGTRESEAEQKDIVIAVNLRPFVKQVLKRLANKYILGIFTAADQNYADEALRLVDPSSTLISFRLYRQHCYISPSNPSQKIKDLRILDSLNLANVAIVQNSPFAYLYQPDNAVPIAPFTDNPHDDQLLKLEAFLHQHVAGCRDVRVALREFFKIGTYDKYSTVRELVDRLIK